MSAPVTPSTKIRCLRLGCSQVNGHSFSELTEAFLPRANATKPLAVIANTIKGKGVSFMEDVVKWHHGVPSDAEFAQAIGELDAAERSLR